ncbi:MAG TPA: glycoside hydrolase family 9 protein [Puia sp.]|nr:glycoside hydrolase family 9 protein [Puia sp.]
MKLQVSLLCFLYLISQNIRAQDSLTGIRLDQEGFYPKAPKVAILTGKFDISSVNSKDKTAFFVILEKNSDTVFRGELSAIRKSNNSSLQTRTADFSSLTQTGLYRVNVAGCCTSFPFEIREKVHRPLAVASLKAFYFQRASIHLEEVYAGKWNRALGHPDDSVIVHPSAASNNRKAGTVISTPGGWYDAGDYNKYIVNSGISMGTLLSAYEDFNSYFDTLLTNIPPLGKHIPDILNEVLYNLRWMLSMQDPEDGGVYNKCTNASFDPMIMPEKARQPRYVVQKGTAATLDLAAVAAQAARIFKNFGKELPGLSDSCLHAAEKAWAWAEVHPNLAYDQNAMNQLYTPKIVTGGYGDRKFSDEWFWAASELFVTTGKRNYRDTILSHINDHFGLPSWSETGLLGYYSILRTKAKYDSPALDDTIRSRLIRMADEYIRNAKNNAFLTVMGGRRYDFVWGSNANAANQGILLIQVYFITHERSYLEAALGNLEYICGRNATGFCFITGIGSHSPMHPHHRPSIADGIVDPVPGLLAGGPNPGEQDHCHYDFHEPETAYVDSDCAYASNEIAINWNSPLVYLSNAIEALQFNFTSSK